MRNKGSPCSITSFVTISRRIFTKFNLPPFVSVTFLAPADELPQLPGCVHARRLGGVLEAAYDQLGRGSRTNVQLFADMIMQPAPTRQEAYSTTTFQKKFPKRNLERL